MTQFTDLSILLLTRIVAFYGLALVNWGVVYFGVAFFRRINNV